MSESNVCWLSASCKLWLHKNCSHATWKSLLELTFNAIIPMKSGRTWNPHQLNLKSFQEIFRCKPSMLTKPAPKIFLNSHAIPALSSSPQVAPVILFIKHKTNPSNSHHFLQQKGFHNQPTNRSANVIEILLFLDPRWEFKRGTDKNFSITTHVYGDVFPTTPSVYTNMNLF